MKHTAFRFDENELKKAKAKAKQNGFTLAWIMRRLLQMWLKGEITIKIDM